MSADAPIINRFLRLRKEVLDPLQPGLTFEGLVDAFIVLFQNCKDETKGKQHLAEFINKFQTTVNNYNKLRISINDFDVKRIIGRGNFADVKLAKEKSSGNVYAMKIMKKTGDKNSAFYEEERDIMARSTSSWLTKLDYAFQDDLHLYLAMEFHAGGDLLSLLDKTGHKLEEPAVRFYTAEVALGIHDLHKMGYVHRDIKPENILLDITGHVKIADFGSSARLNTAGLVTKVIPVGTPEYIAPEVLQCLQSKTGAKSHGAECDYWSLGILAYEMMFGETPFSDLDGSVINTYSNIMAHKQVEFPSNEECSGELKSLIKRLLSSAPKRIGHQNLIRHPFFGDIDWNNMRNQKPPHVPQVKRADDTSNFDVIEEEPSNIDISSLTDKKTLKHLPFVGFTFTSDKGKLKSLETKESTSLETELKTKASELENYKLRIFQLEQQIFSTTRTHETSQRDFEATEKLTYELSMAENENTQLKTNIKNLERVLEIERQERSATEHKTLQVLQDVRNKWAKKEEEKLDKLRTELKEEQDKSSELETTLSSTRRELKATKSELESVKGIKTQLKNKLKDYKQRLENVAALEEKRSETIKQLEHENSKLKDVVSETTSALNESRSIEGKVDALQLIIEQRDQILAEKNAEIKIKSAEVESFAALHTADKKTIKDLESKFRSAQVDLKKLQRDIDNLHQDKSETEEVNTTVVQMRTELTEAISEIATLRDQAESLKSKEQTLAKEVGKLNQELEKKDLDKEKVVRRLKKEFQEKEEDWKNKIKGLEEVFETLQAKIDDLQKKRREEVREKGRKEVLELEEKLEKMEDLVEEKRREEERLKAVVRKQEKENTELKGKVNDCEVVIVEIEQKKIELEKTIQEEKETEAESTELLEKVMHLEKELREVKLDLRIEKRETEKKSGIVKYYREKEDKSKEKITELETRISDLEKELGDIRAEKDRLDLEVKGLEKSKERMEKMKEDLEKIKQEKLEISMEKRRLETEVSGSERRIERLEKEIQGFAEEKEKFKSIQINNDALKGLCEDLDRQVTEFEAAAESLEDKVQVLEAEKRELVSKVDLVQEDSRKVKIAVNEEKSVKLFTEKKLKTMEQKLEDYEKEANKGKEVYEKNLSEYKELCNKLSGALEELTGKNMKMEQTGNSLEKLKSSLEYENSQLKIELGEKTTQLHSHKESNFKLTHGIEEAIKKIEQKNQQIDEIHLKIETDSRIMSELVTRHEATIAQQTKLIDFLQQKVGELEGRKKTLADKIFGNKENRPDNHLVLGYQDIQQQLQTERIKNRKISDQLSRVRAEVVALKTNSQDKNIPRSVINQIDDKMTATHNIPHRLHQGANKKSSRCPVCQDTVGFMMLAQICKDCGVSVHSGCSSDLPPTCGLSVQLVSALQGAMTPRSRANSSSRARSSSESRGNKDRPLPIPPVNTNKEGEVLVLLRGDWVESVLVLTLDNILDIYQDASRNIRIDQIALTAPHCRVSVQPSVSFSEVYYVSASDRPYTFKLTVHVTGKSEKAVYLMCKNFAQKVEWVNRLEEVITSSPSNMVPIPDGCNEHCKELIAAVPADTEILAMDTVGDVVLIGTTKGLLIRDLSNEVGELRSIEGVDVPVHRIKYIKSIQSVMLATGSDGSTGSQLVTVCARAVQAGSTVHPEPVPEISHCHIFAANENSKGHVYLCAANKHQVSIFEWSPKRAGFVIRNKFSTDKYTGCIYFTEHSVLVGTTKFYEIDLKNFSAEEFLDTCDPGIKRTLKSAEFEGSEPCDVLPILIRGAEPEYILCFTRHLLFVDGYGQQTREPMLFTKLPLESTLIGSVLATSFSDRIQLITFDLENTENSTTTLVEVFSAMPHLVGAEKNKLYYTTPGDAAYHLVALDVTKLKQEV